MQPLTETLMHSPLKNRIFRDVQLKDTLPGSDQSRYGLVNRALAAGEIWRIRRGMYVLDQAFRDRPCHPFAIAQALTPMSYVSFETALAWHDWIPEAVRVVTSVVPGRKRSSLETPDFGSFSFVPLALKRMAYLEGVSRQQADGQTFLLASPLRALFDLVCLRKLDWSGIDFLTDDLRIDHSALEPLSGIDCMAYLPVYKHQQTRRFIEALARHLSPPGADA